MLGMIDGADKEGRVFCVMNNRTKENLLPFTKDNILTNNEPGSECNEEEEEERVINEENVKTRIYSDCFSSY